MTRVGGAGGREASERLTCSAPLFQHKGEEGRVGENATARNWFGKLKYKLLNKDRYPSLWGIFVSVFGQRFGLSIGEAFEQDKMQLVLYFNSDFFL